MNVGIVCEYNPFHRGHWKQIRVIREKFGANTGIICAMSGNYVQRGHPAIFDKILRAEAALRCGADLVVELPVTAALSSAEGFASGGVAVLSRLCDGLCFGVETADPDLLEQTARVLLDEAFPPLLRRELDKGRSFPAARQAALEKMGLSGKLLESPNNILAVEYCKAILRQSSGAPMHTLEAGERAVLSKLRTMSEEEFEALPFGSEGLWRKLMHESSAQATLEEIAFSVKSKRYTRSRIDRMILCAYLGITAEMMNMDIPYVRVLGFSNRGREILNSAKKSGFFVNAGQPVIHPLWELEQKWDDLYGLFQEGTPGRPGGAKNNRVIYLP